MDQRDVTTWYVSRRMTVAPEDAGQALDVMITPETTARIRWGPLELEKGMVREIRSCGSERRIAGRLHLARRRPVRVELELTPWSRAESVLGLRPSEAPKGGRATSYFAAAIQSLDALRARLEQSVEVVSRGEEILDRAS